MQRDNSGKDVGYRYPTLCAHGLGPPEAVPPPGFTCRRFTWEMTLGNMSGGVRKGGHGGKEASNRCDICHVSPVGSGRPHWGPWVTAWRVSPTCCTPGTRKPPRDIDSSRSACPWGDRALASLESRSAESNLQPSTTSGNGHFTALECNENLGLISYVF